MPGNRHHSRFTSHRLLEPDRGLTHGAGSYEPRVRTITEAALRQLNLKLSCRLCGHIRVLHCAALHFLFERGGWDDRLRALPDRFWCSQCWQRTRAKVKNPDCAFVNEDETGTPLPMPDVRTWSGLTRRYRS